MLISYKLGQSSIILRVKIRNSSVSTGAGLTGLTSASTGLIIAVTADNEQPPSAGSGSGFGVAYTAAGSTIESITTLGTYAAPTATKCRFKELDSTNHKGIYELQIADARFNVGSSKSVLVSISSATNAAECEAVIPLTTIDPYDVNGNLQGLNGTTAPTAGALITSGTGTAQLSVSSGQVTVGTLAAAAIASIWNALTSGMTTAGSIGKKLADWVLGSDNKVLLSSSETGAGLSSVAPASTALSTANWTTARAGYLDNLNVGGLLASHADITALNTSASKHLLLVTVGQFEPGETYTVECRTFSAADGSAVNADTTPTLTATGQVSGSLSANLSAATNPATGLYRWTYTPGASPTLEQIRFDVSATISSSTFTLSAYSQTVDEATVVFTSTDQGHLTSLFNAIGADVTLATSQPNYAPAKAGDKMDLVDAPNATALAAFFSEILTTALTEAYAAKGAAPTLAEILFEIRANLCELAISSTTYTANKLDGTTPAATYTLDSSSSPTSKTRAT